MGNLGTALANYSGFYSHGFRVVGLIDTSPDLVGKRIHGLAIADLSELEDVVAKTGAVIAVIATPADAAQAVADRLVYLGVTSILNFAPTVLVVPEGVNVRKVDLGQELQILAYHEQRKSDDSPDLGQEQEDQLMSILVVSVSHKSTSVSHLAQLALDAAASAKLAEQLVGSEHIDEAVVLSTCNRTELYASVTRFHGALDDATQALADIAGLRPVSCGHCVRSSSTRVRSPTRSRWPPGWTRW